MDSASLTSSTATADATARLRQAADELVGSVFYGTMLRQLRSSSLQGPYGHGGKGERVFQAQLDQIIAQRAGRRESTSLTDAVVRRYETQSKQMSDFHAAQRDARQALTAIDRQSARPSLEAE